MLQRKRDRVLELEEIRSKTRHVIRRFEGAEPPTVQTTPFQNRVISIDIQEIGIAFPLSEQLDIKYSGKGPSSPVAAFLFSIESMLFATQREESGTARIVGVAFQFVPSYVLSTLSSLL